MDRKSILVLLFVLAAVVGSKPPEKCPGFRHGHSLRQRSGQRPGRHHRGYCITDYDCAYTEACDRTGRCVNACIKDPCGLNAMCTAADHMRTCTCVDGFVGDPTPADGCREECPMFCDLSGTCASVCRDGNTLVTNFLVECVNDVDCQLNEACDTNGNCINPCDAPDAPTCGMNAECIPGGNHDGICVCQDMFIGDPLNVCRPACTPANVATDCADNEACGPGGCQDACELSPCGTNADCVAANNMRTCSCPVSFMPNPAPEVECILGCVDDTTCSSVDTCDETGLCQPICDVQPCAVNADCTPDTVADVRIRTCACSFGFFGADATTQCDPACFDPAVDCLDNEVCPDPGNGGCVDACMDSDPMCTMSFDANSECLGIGNSPTCICSTGFVMNTAGDGCNVDCDSDAECQPTERCFLNGCVDACDLFNDCASVGMMCMVTGQVTSCVPIPP